MRKLIFLCLLFAVPVFVPVFAQPRNHQPLLGTQINWSVENARGLVGVWLLNEGSGQKVFDISGNGYDGTLTTMDASDWVPGDAGHALDFDNGSDYIATAAIDILHCTIIVKARSTAVSDREVLANRTFDGSSVPYSLNISPGSSLPGMAFFDGTWRTSGVTTDVSGDDVWHIFGGSYDGETLKYYIDETLDSSSAFSGTLPQGNTNVLDIGRYASDAVFFGGQIEFVLLYDRALTDQAYRSMVRNCSEATRRSMPFS